MAYMLCACISVDDQGSTQGDPICLKFAIFNSEEIQDRKMKMMENKDH